MKKEIRLYEELSMNAHPALQIMHYDGWILRFARGYSGRANSVNMLFPSTISVEEKIQTCEHIYQEHNLPAIFKLTDGMSDIDKLLENRGYEFVTPTTLMTLPTASFHGTSTSAVLEDNIHERWQNAYFHLVETDESHIQPAREIQAAIQNKTLCASISDDTGTIIACGLCVIEREFAGLFDIVVDTAYRRKGYGADLCTALINKATSHGVKTMYLQVLRDNTSAVQMYHKLGFKPQYDYWYRIR